MMKNAKLRTLSVASVLGLTILAGLVAAPNTTALPQLGWAAGYVSFSHERSYPCSNPENINWVCYILRVRPNIWGSSAVSGFNTATTWLDGQGSSYSNYCSFFSPLQLTCENQDPSGKAGVYNLVIVSPGAFYCRNYFSLVKNDASGAVIDTDSGRNCYQVPVV
jgi:hypothetical protein